MESISLLGNSKTNIELAKKFKEEINEIDGKVIEVYDASLDSMRKIRILIGPWIWDSVQRWFSLFLESKTCSKCKCPKEDYHKCPKDISEISQHPLRTISEAKKYQEVLKMVNLNMVINTSL